MHDAPDLLPRAALIGLLAVLAWAPVAFADGPGPGAGALPVEDEVLKAERRVPVLFQRQSPLCLPTAAVALARYHGHQLELMDVARSVPVSVDGVAWDDVLRSLHNRGIEARYFRADPAGLRAVLAAGHGAVVGQAKGTRGHAIVVERYDAARGIYVVMDPANPGVEALEATELEARAAPTGYRGFVVPDAR